MNNISQQSDEQVVELVRTKDQEIFSEIINRYQIKLLRYATYLTQDDYLAADVVQETFIKAFINLQSFNVKKRFSSWIYRIAHNQAINALKKQKKYSPIIDNLDISSDQDIEGDLLQSELRDQVQNCLEYLPILYREPLTLFYLEKKSYKEISDILRIPTKTVATRISRAKKQIRVICQNQLKNK